MNKKIAWERMVFLPEESNTKINNLSRCHGGGLSVSELEIIYIPKILAMDCSDEDKADHLNNLTEALLTL
jgi:hypothetical protein